MNNYLLVIFLLFSVFTGKNQDTNNIQNLRLQLNTSASYLDINPEKAIAEAKKGLILCNENDYYKGSFLGIIGYGYFLKSDIDNALLYTKKSIRYLSKTDSIKQLSKSYSTLGLIYYKTRNYDRAIKIFKICIKNQNKVNDKKGIAVSDMNIGAVYDAKGEYQYAIYYYLKALEYYEQTKNHRNYYSLLIDIGGIYDKMGNYKKALEYNLKAKHFVLKSKSNIDSASFYMNTGIIYKNLDSIDNAYRYYRKALKIAQNIKNDHLFAMLYNNLGNLFFEINKFDSALVYFNNSLAKYTKCNDTAGITLTYINIGKVYLKTENIEKSLIYLEKAKKNAKEYSLKLKLLYVYELQTKIYEKQAKYKKAFIAQTNYYSLRDEIFNIEKQKQIEKIQAKHKIKEKEQKVKILTQKNHIKDLEIKKYQYYKFLFILIIIFLSTLSFIIYNRFKIKKRANTLLEKQKKELDILNKKLNTVNNDLQQTNSNLKELNKTKDKFFSIISHDLKNPLNVLYATTDLLIKNMDSFPTKKISIYLQNMKRSSENLINFLNNLLEWAQMQTGKINVVKENFDLFDIVEQNLLIQIDVAHYKEIEISSEIKKNTIVYGDKEMISTVIRNLLSNAIKFTNRKGKITISAKEHNKIVTVSIADTGIGISDDEIKNLFNAGIIHKKQGTENEKGTGLGLILCKEFIERNNGKLTIKSNVNKGSIFSFTLNTSL
jgi:signal transduction histidine kinase